MIFMETFFNKKTRKKIFLVSRTQSRDPNFRGLQLKVCVVIIFRDGPMSDLYSENNTL